MSALKYTVPRSTLWAEPSEGINLYRAWRWVYYNAVGPSQSHSLGRATRQGGR